MAAKQRPPWSPTTAVKSSRKPTTRLASYQRLPYLGQRAEEQIDAENIEFMNIVWMYLCSYPYLPLSHGPAASNPICRHNLYMAKQPNNTHCSNRIA